MTAANTLQMGTSQRDYNGVGASASGGINCSKRIRFDVSLHR